MKLTEVTQKKLEDYEELMLEQADGVRSAAKFNRIVLEAARDVGIAVELPNDLFALAPWQIPEYTRLVIEHVAKAKQPPHAGES